MIIKEYRIVLPLTVEEYYIGQLYMTAKTSKEATGGGEGFQILVNEPYSNENGSGQYTHKVLHIGKSLPRIASAILPSKALIVEERSWNAYPYCKTVNSCPFFGDKLTLIIESIHKPGRGEEHNAFNLPPNVLQHRIIDFIDIANDPIERKDYKPTEDPRLVRSQRANRGPLVGNWTATANPVMTCYKLVTVEFKVWGLQKKVENIIQKTGIRDVFLKAHRSLYCWLDEWWGMDIAGIRVLEESTKQTLNNLMKPQM